MHPVGPHNSGVYWLRRVVAIAVVVIVIVAAVWWVANRSSGPDVDPTASSGSSETTDMTGVLAPDLPTTRSSSGADAGGASTTSDTATDRSRTSTGENTGQDEASDTSTSSATTSSAKKSSSKKSGAKKSSSKKTETKKTDAKKSNSKKTDAKKTETKKSSSEKTSAKKSDAKKSHTKKSSSDASPTSSDKSTDSTSTSTTKSTAKSTPTTTAPPKPSYDAQGRLICSDADTAVKSILWSATVPAGSQPRLGMTVTNTGPKTCRRDVSGTLQVYTVYTADGDHVWSTNDCFPGTGHEVRTLAPGATATYVIKWAGTTSTPGCDTPRVAVKPGKYTLVAQLGDIKGTPAPFTVTG